MWRAARAVLCWGVAGTLTALPACTPYVHGYAYTTHQSLSSGAPPASPQPSASATTAASSPDPSSGLPSGMHSATSDRLTYYLQGHRLPLVGAEVADAAGGNHKVILYGFVATDHGKADAEAKTRSFLEDPGAEIDNRIVVKPELRTPSSSLNAATSSFPPPAAPPPPGAPPSQPTQLQPAQINELLGALLMGMAIVSALPATAAPATAAPPSSGSSPGPPPSP